MAILKLCFIGVVSNFTMGLFCWTYFASVSRAVSYQPIKEVMATLKQSGSFKVSGEGLVGRHRTDLKIANTPVKSLSPPCLRCEL